MNDPLTVEGVPALIHDYFKARLATPHVQLDIEVDLNSDHPKPPGIRSWLGTEDVDGPATEFDQRISRCNELTNYALLWGSAPDDAHLIHGSMHGRFDGNQRIRHSWLVLRRGDVRLVWEPITALWHNMDAWYEYARAWDEREYVKRQVQQMTLATRHFGPWHESRYP